MPEHKEGIKKYRCGSEQVESLRFVNGNFKEVEEFIGADVEYRAGLLIVPTKHGVKAAKDGHHIVKFKSGFIQVMDYITFRGRGFEMVREG